MQIIRRCGLTGRVLSLQTIQLNPPVPLWRTLLVESAIALVFGAVVAVIYLVAVLLRVVL
jgi:hypothetical protein